MFKREPTLASRNDTPRGFVEGCFCLWFVVKLRKVQDATEAQYLFQKERDRRSGDFGSEGKELVTTTWKSKIDTKKYGVWKMVSPAAKNGICFQRSHIPPNQKRKKNHRSQKCRLVGDM